jgi:hypothetical protein
VLALMIECEQFCQTAGLFFLLDQWRSGQRCSWMYQLMRSTA